jgi:hypothetical protein
MCGYELVQQFKRKTGDPWVGTRSKREEARDHAALRRARRTMIRTDAEQPKHAESDRDGATEGLYRRGRKKETDPGRGACVFLCPLDPPSPTPLAPAVRRSRATHSTTAVMSSHGTAIHCRQVAAFRLPYASAARTHNTCPPSLSAVRPAFLVCNSSPEKVCAHTRPYSRPRPRSRVACGLSGLSTLRGLWPRRNKPSSIFIRTHERLLVRSEL